MPTLILKPTVSLLRINMTELRIHEVEACEFCLRVSLQ